MAPLRLLTYNLFLMPKPYMWTDIGTRLPRITDYIRSVAPGLDVVVLTEVFRVHDQDFVYKALASAFPYMARMQREPWTFLSGGVMILSRYPLDGTQFIQFTTATQIDSLASKGALMVRVMRPRLPVTLVAVHLQAWSENAHVRQEQVTEIRTWLNTHIEDKTEPVLLVGDLNQNHSQTKRLFPRDKVARKHPRSEHGSSVDPRTNTLACWSQGKDYVPEMVDYAVALDGYRKPSELTFYVQRAQTSVPYPVRVWKYGFQPRSTVLETRDLSDHYPVLIRWHCGARCARAHR